MLRTRTKLAYGLGDHTITYSLSALSLFYLFFLTEYAGLRPALAGAVLLVGRCVDAVTDPLMGRLSDVTNTRWGRRRPYFAIAAVPFGLAFALLWTQTPAESQLAKFGYYAGLYVFYSVVSTVIAVPYIALLPELARTYEERTSLASFRSGLAVAGTLLAAVATHPVVASFGGGAAGYEAAGLLGGLWVAVWWLPVFLATREEKRVHRSESSLGEGIALLLAHASYRRLSLLYLLGRMTMDVAGAMFIYFFQYWMRRPDDHGPTLAALLGVSILSLPFWVRVSHRLDKHHVLIAGSLWWMAISVLLLVVQPDWPRSLVFAFAAAVGIGYAVVDLMPWAMLADVVDEDELRSGERREGVYSGFFTFVRKLAGASGVALAGVVLDLAGYVPDQVQPESALTAIRALTALTPIVLLGLTVALAWRYPLTRAAHARIRSEIEARGGAS